MCYVFVVILSNQIVIFHRRSGSATEESVRKSAKASLKDLTSFVDEPCELKELLCDDEHYLL